jgi:hypothetical protein
MIRHYYFAVLEDAEGRIESNPFSYEIATLRSQ